LLCGTTDLGTKCLKFSAIFATSDKKRLPGLPIPQPIRCRRGARQGISIRVQVTSIHWESSMLKFAVMGVASLAFVGTAVAADLPRPQPQPVAAPVGKYPMGKYPVGKNPVGKYPVAAPLVTKG
jgi:hypothetical protein